MVEALQRRPRLSLGQARRSELQRSDLRQPLRQRGRRDLQPDHGPAAASPAATEQSQPQRPARIPPGGTFARSRNSLSSTVPIGPAKDAAVPPILPTAESAHLRTPVIIDARQNRLPAPRFAAPAASLIRHGLAAR